MSFKEVTQLRKDGRLEDATAMAREDLARVRDEWSCKALFWCLHEEAKTATIERLTQLAEEMQNLLETIGNDDVAVSCMQRIEARLDPNTNIVKDALELAKNAPREAIQAYETIFALYSNQELNGLHYKDFGWIIYYALHADRSNDVIRRKRLLHTYLMLNLERPSMLHSLIMAEATKVEEGWPLQFMFTQFVAMWNLNNLRDEDWQRFKTEDNHTCMSLVEKIIGLYAKEVHAVEAVHPSDEFMGILNRAIETWNDDDNLLRYKAIICKKEGDIDCAIKLYKRIIELTCGQKYYIWSEMSALVNNVDLKIGLLCKPLLLRVNEEFLGNVRAQLAQLLCDKRLYGNALYEIKKVEQTYQANNWNIPSDIKDMVQLIPANTDVVDNSMLYASWAIKADEYMYAETPTVYMIKVAHKEDTITRDGGRPKRIIKWTLINQQGEVIGVKPKTFNLQRAEIGDCFAVKIVDNKVIYISPIDRNMCSWCKEVNGQISIRTNNDGKSFGFVDNCYVPGNLLHKIKNGEKVDGIAICQESKWRCISVRKMR